MPCPIPLEVAMSRIGTGQLMRYYRTNRNLPEVVANDALRCI